MLLALGWYAIVTVALFALFVLVVAVQSAPRVLRQTVRLVRGRSARSQPVTAPGHHRAAA